MKTIGFDGTAEGPKALKSGTSVATIAKQSVEFGKPGAELAAKTIEREKTVRVKDVAPGHDESERLRRMSACAGSVVIVGSINVDLVIRVDRQPLPGETLIGK